MNVLVVEDDALLAAGLTSALKMTDYSVTHAATGNTAIAQLRTFDFDLVILDLGLPDMDGVEILKLIRNRKLPLPVLVLTARDGMDQQVAALDAGADDYMEKPFDLRELQARVRALLRRSHIRHDQELTIGSVSLDPFNRKLTINKHSQDIPAREFAVLETLMLHAGKAVSKQRLAQRLTVNGEEIGDNAVEVYIHRLRRRLDSSNVGIQTVRNMGYVLEAK